MADRRDAQQSSQSASSGEDDSVGKAAQTTNGTEAPSQQDQPDGQKQPSKLKQLWAKIGLDVGTVVIMVKGSLPPIIALSMYQADAVAQHYSTLGYLVAIASILGFCIMPRGKFIQTMVLNILAVCFAAALNLLALYCVTQARLHTTPRGQTLGGYNSSASAVCAIWLIVQTYFINVVRAARPQFQFPMILYSIFVDVSMTYGVEFTTMAVCVPFMKKLLEAFLTGFALATAVHFFVMPMSSRMVVFKEMTGYLMCLSGMLKAQTAYMASLEDIDPVKMRKEREAAADGEGTKKKAKKGGGAQGPLTTPALLKMKEMLGKTMELHTKLHGDITPAKREFAFGKLESHDLTELWKLLRMIFLPITGLSASIDLLNRAADENHWDHDGANEHEKSKQHEQVENVHFLMKQLHEPFAHMTEEIDAAIMHVLITLELIKPPKKGADEESKGDKPTPGSSSFAEDYKRKVDEFYSSKQKTLNDWCKAHNIDLPDDFFESTFVGPEKVNIGNESVRERYQQQLFFTLYLEYMLWKTSVAVLELVLYADKRKSEGALKHSKLIFPGSKTLYKWLKAVFGQEDLSEDIHTLTDMDAGGAESMYLGEEFARHRGTYIRAGQRAIGTFSIKADFFALDPEHLPPCNAAERLGEAIRSIPQFFRSDASAFGFRVVVATMTIGIVCFLEATQTFFLEQRLLWAMIMTAISMTRTAGQSTFQFALRIGGTVIAMIGSYIVWYIVVGHTAGVLVFLWLWVVASFYFVIKTPKLTIVAILALVTNVLINGYELQVKKLGVQASESNGQPAYPTYVLAPYRLATVCGGILVAFIWTIFPYPISESSLLRKDLGASLYLLSNFYSIVHETVQSRVKGTDGDALVKGTHAYNLEKARNTVFSKLLLLLTNLKTNAEFSKFQLRVGGRFPRENYEGLIDMCQKVLQHTALIAYASATLSMHNRDDRDGEPSQWSNDFRKLIASVNHTSHQITSVLSLLSSSLHNGQALPPYLEMPKPFHLVKKLELIDSDLLSVRHIAEPEYSAFAVMGVCAQALNQDIAELTRHVKALVGEIDFSFHAVKSSNEGTYSSSLESDKGDGKDE